MEPDLHIRSKLQALEDEEGGELSQDAHRRVARAVGEHGPGAVARGRSERMARRSAGLFLAAGAAVFVMSAITGEETSEQRPLEAMPQTLPAAAAPACATRALPAGAAFAPQPSGAARLDLGARGEVVTTTGTLVHIETLSRCSLVLALEEGSVSVHARDLGGGELAVRTADALIAVRGTRFAVRRAEGGTSVEVAEGVVAVLVGGVERAQVGAGQTARVEEDRLTLGEQETAAAHVPSPSPRPAPLDRPRRPREPREPRLGAEDLSVRGAQRERAGDLEGARQDYATAARLGGVAGEAAMLSLARLELRLGRIARARQALRMHEARFRRGQLGLEAAWIGVQVESRAGDRREARRLARFLVEQHPGTSQAAAAERWLEQEERR